MPKGVDNLLNFQSSATATQSATKSRKSFETDRADTPPRESFRKALDKAKPPAKTEQPQPKAKSNESKVKKDHDCDQNIAVDEPVQDESESSTLPVDESQPVVDDDAVAESDHPDEKPASSSDETDDSIQAAILAAYQQQPAQPTPLDQAVQVEKASTDTEPQDQAAELKLTIANPKPVIQATNLTDANALESVDQPESSQLQDDEASQSESTSGVSLPKELSKALDTNQSPDMEVPPIVSAPKAKSSSKQSEKDSADSALQQFAQLQDWMPDDADAPPAQHHDASADRLLSMQNVDLQPGDNSQIKAPPSNVISGSQTAPPPAPAPDFAESNHDRIVTSMRSQLLPSGGTMHLRLDPPELGVLQVTVRMVDGAMTASFETSNDQATKLLSHSLGQLKQVLETQGVNVEKLHVQQTPQNQQGSSSGEDREQRPDQDNQSARQEQQRREMLQRMWRRVRGGGDPLDLVA